MSKLLQSAAVGTKSGEDAKEILQTYLETEPSMVLSHAPTIEASPQQQPRGMGAGDHLIEPR